jgi:hypothetical protein
MTPWQPGYPKEPGWYVLHYDSGKYEVVKLVSLSALFLAPDPGIFGIKRHFSFSTLPAQSEL